MSRFSTQKSSFIHIYNKYGPQAVKNHTYLTLLKHYSDKSKDWLRVDREIAQILVQLKSMHEKVMCREVELENRAYDKYYVAVYKTDLDKNKQFPEKWKTFVVIL